MDGAEHYQFLLATDSVFNSIKFNSISYSGRLDYNNLDFHTKYFWKIRAFDGLQYTDWTPVHSFSTISELSFPKNGEYKIPVNVLLEWNKSEFSNTYELKIAKDENFENDAFVFTGLNSNYYSIKDLAYNTTYYWSIRSFKLDKFTNWTEPFKFTTLLEEPVLVIPEDNSMLNSGELFFNWLPTPDANAYHLQVSTDSSFTDIILDIDLLENSSCKIHEILTAPIYYWRVASFNAQNASGWSAVKSFRLNSISNIKTNYGKENFKFINFPNSFESETHFQLSLYKKLNVNLKIYSLEGNAICTIIDGIVSPGEYNYTWYSGNNNSGFYYFILQAGDEIKSGKLVLIK